VVAVIVDSAQPGSGVANDWEQVASLHFEVPVIVAGGIGPETVTAVITATRPWGVDVASGVEILHGVKDPAKVASFVSRARAALTQKGAQ
jgi:phosphoribosylanthranilate isomerase